MLDEDDVVSDSTFATPADVQRVVRGGGVIEDYLSINTPWTAHDARALLRVFKERRMATMNELRDTLAGLLDDAPRTAVVVGAKSYTLADDDAPPKAVKEMKRYVMARVRSVGGEDGGE